MKLHYKTGVTETGELRITKSTGAILIGCSKPLSDLTNERITIHIEKEGGNSELHTNVLLRHFIAESLYGDGNLKQTTVGVDVSFIALCELGRNGSIPLGVNESIKVAISTLEAAETYKVFSLEYPQIAESIFYSEKNTILNDETSRSFNVSNSRMMTIEGWQFTRDTTFTFINGHRVKYTREELEMITFDLESSLGVDITNGQNVNAIGDALVLSLEGVVQIDFEKIKGFQEVTFANEMPIQ
ncbi:hypothetical protein N7U66_02000 [Lacinutrix neustonica]|uniref:Uncharacterized protein n=1 Tax=Lacinutrix neustonica TaxID=2980107 RepID=A0A9E8SEN5_9FLAO|nr:hypothetical protein [Lacinutrix neustonica]WAC02509.1 hypothetical protein N7U66_02000 [Lacinutrix neustonica]